MQPVSVSRSRRATTLAVPALQLPSPGSLILRDYFERHESLSASPSRTYEYSTFRTADFVDVVSNEPGLEPCLTALRAAGFPAGGAAIGVSGSILDVASKLRSDLVISLDANPRLADTLGVVTAILLAVDDLARRQGLSDRKRAEAIAWRLSPATLASDARHQIISELRAAGWPQGRAADLPRLLTMIGQSFWSPKAWGAASFWYNSADAGARVRHLTELAKAGRILAVTADLGQASFIDRVNSLLLEHQSSMAVFNLSNAPDYIPDVYGALRNLGALRRRADAKVVSSAYRLRPTPVLDSLTVQLCAALGTIENPGVADAKTLFGDGTAAGLGFAAKKLLRRYQ
jgi:hypothetical protein